MGREFAYSWPQGSEGTDDLLNDSKNFVESMKPLYPMEWLEGMKGEINSPLKKRSSGACELTQR